MQASKEDGSLSSPECSLEMAASAMEQALALNVWVRGDQADRITSQ